MFGRNKTEDIFEKEERLRDELEAARGQLAESVAKITATDAEYRRAAAAALASGDDDSALKLRQALDKLGVRRDGLAQRILDLEPQYQEATQLAQAERLRRIEQERRDRFAALVAQGAAAAEKVRSGFETFMRTLSDLDNLRELLAVPDLASLGGLHEVERLSGLVSQFALHQMLTEKGFRPRNAVPRPTYLEVCSLRAPL
jgi:hypothetical protein